MNLRAFGRRAVFGMAVAGVLVSQAQRTQAADPVIVVSIKSLNEVFADAAYLGEVTGQPALQGLLAGGLNQLTGGVDLEGLDADRTIGAFLSLNEAGEPDQPVVFIPVKNRKQFNATLAKLFEKKGTKDGITEFAHPSGLPIFGLDDGDWYFFSIKPEALDDLPKPALLVKSKADFAIEVDVDKIPKQFRDGALTQLQSEMSKKEPKDDAEKFGQQFATDLFTSLVNDTSRFSLSLDIDAKEKFIGIDTGLIARRGTSMAAAFDAFAKVKSSYTDLVTDDTVASVIVALPISESIRTGLSDAFDQGVKEASARGNKKGDKEARRFAATVKQAFSAPQMDLALIANNRRGKLQLVAALSVPNGDDLSDLFDELIEKAPTPNDDLKVNVAQHNEVAIHALNPKIADPQVKKLFGNSLLHFAIDSDRVVVSFGSQSLNGAKAALDVEADEDSELAPFGLQIGVGAALPLIKDETNAALVDKAAEVLEDGNDEIYLEVEPQPRGIKVHFEVQEGVLKLGTLVGQ